jgi:hypothetical protein
MARNDPAVEEFQDALVPGILEPESVWLILSKEDGNPVVLR